ncbi:MAG: hypothetical protein K9W44_07200 [Candidatus Lokiarchaeota archaeon]|nr:hypothetical protein [Candidatus Harpocratesius repetitus]
MRIISVNQDEIAQLKEKIRSLEEEMEFLKEDLEAADDEVEELEHRLQLFEQDKGVFYKRKEILEKIYEIIQTAQHNIIITTPLIQDVGELSLFEINANINIKVACSMALDNQSDKEIMEELSAFDNINIRIYEGKDRWCALIDGEKLIFGALGLQKDHILVFQTNDSNHIRIFNTLVMESWLRGKKINFS